MMEKKGFYFDLVVCIDKTTSMSSQIGFISDFVNGFYDMAKTQINGAGFNLKKLRINVITFSDYNVEKDAVVESGFFTMPDKSVELFTYLENIKANVESKTKGYSSGLEGLYFAMRSKFLEMSDKDGRQAIIVFSNNKPLPLSECRELPYYPKKMPETLLQLKEKWENVEYNRNKKMLTLFCNLQKGDSSWYPIDRWESTMVIDTEDISEFTLDFILETILIDII